MAEAWASHLKLVGFQGSGLLWSDSLRALQGRLGDRGARQLDRPPS